MEGPTRFVPASELAARIGAEIGVSEWITLDQPSIDTFARLTHDTYFIHVDPRRAAATPFGGTIAHGFMTLSMLSVMAYQVVPGIEGTRQTVNYGFDRLRFVAPVPSGARVRGRFVLHAFEDKGQGRWRAEHDVTVEIEGAERPAIVARWLTAGI